MIVYQNERTSTSNGLVSLPSSSSSSSFEVSKMFLDPNESKEGGKRIRNVQFSSSVQTIEISNFSCEQECNDTRYIKNIRKQIWYNDDEMFLMRMTVVEDAKDGQLLRSYCIDEETYRRGKKHQLRRETIENVLRQQELLWEDQLEDAELIAEVYSEDTRISQLEATQRGIEHAKHVSSLVQTTTNKIYCGIKARQSALAKRGFGKVNQDNLNPAIKKIENENNKEQTATRNNSTNDNTDGNTMITTSFLQENKDVRDTCDDSIPKPTTEKTSIAIANRDTNGQINLQAQGDCDNDITVLQHRRKHKKLTAAVVYPFQRAAFQTIKCGKHVAHQFFNACNIRHATLAATNVRVKNI